jgi:pyruvate/2-oxoglutarate dehydrogenase complex dihydrolipoamide dehydrogenase (E3) component
MPAAVFTDPQVASVGTTSGDQVVTGVHMIAGGTRSTCARRGLLEPAVGTNESVIVGALAVGPEAGEWIGQLTLAVRARIPIEIRLDIFSALQALEGRL